MTDDGHRYTFASPSKGWPTFGPDGKIITDNDQTETNDNDDRPSSSPR